MSTAQLLESILQGGIRNTHFFNGRLLTAEDLRVEQQATRQHHQQLGQAIGAGVIHGLQVRDASGLPSLRPTPTPVVTVSSGLALNRKGQVLFLPTDSEVALVRERQSVAAGAGLFAECEPPETTATVTGTGVYILVLAPASGFEERAPSSGLTLDGKIPGCGSRYEVEGVRFRLVRLDVRSISGISPATRAQLTELMAADDTASLSKLRNLLAHLCFGTEELAAFPRQPFAVTDAISQHVTYGVLDQLRHGHGLTDCDVPLALLYWTTSGIPFVDMWSVRRRLVQAFVDDTWPLHVGQRRQAEAEAVFVQFQHQIQTLRLRETRLSSITALDHFRYLPPAGYLPIGIREFDRDTFFQGVNVDLLTVDTASVRLLLHQSCFLEPIDLTKPPPIRVYRTLESPDYLVFVRGERPQPIPIEPEEPSPPAPGTTSRPGQINIDIDLGEGRPLTGTTEIYPQEKGDIQVWAEDEGNAYKATFVPIESSLSVSGGPKVVSAKGVARFVVRELPPGSYTVHVKMKGFKPASQKRSLGAGEIIHLVFRMVPETKKPGKTQQPPDSIEAKDVWPGWYGEMAIIPESVNWPWPAEEQLEQGPVEPLPPKAETWLQDWSDWLRIRYPDAAFDPGGIRICIDATHTPDVVADRPYAFVLFGEGGASAPLVLTPTDSTLDRPVSVRKGELSGFDPDVEERLKAAGLQALDVLGSSWTDIVAETLGIEADTARRVIEEARTQAEGLRDSLRIFDGVDARVEADLQRIGIADAVDLANADPETIAAELGEAGVSLTFAGRLVDQARRVVPQDAWSLGALGLNEREITALETLGVKTQGILRSRAGETGGPESIETALGVGTSTVEALATRVDASKANVLETRKASVPVTKVFGVNRETARLLAESGFGTVGALATADTNRVAVVFGGDTARASALIEAARARLA